MIKILISNTLIAATLMVAGCGKSAEKTASDQPATVAPPAARKCPDPNIRDPKDPCSPYYWQPKGSALKNSKSF